MWWVLMGVFAVAGAQEPHRPPSPCPNIYSYEKDILDGWRGLISIITPPKFSEMMLVVRLSSPVPITADNVGKLELKGGSDTIDELAGEVAEGRKFTLRYFVIFPKGKPIPTLLSVNVNGKEFCRAKDVPTNTRSHITLHTKLSTGLHFDSDEANGFEPPNGTITGIPEISSTLAPTTPSTTSLPAVSNSIVTKKPLSNTPSGFINRPSNQFTPIFMTDQESDTFSVAPMQSHYVGSTAEHHEDYTRNCGVVTANILFNALVVRGTKVEKKGWPWQAAIFMQTDVDGIIANQFRCGGTLVSNKHVITAAHCVAERHNQRLRPVSARALGIYLGKNNIHLQAEEGQQIIAVQEIFVHPDYNPENNESDLAILLFKFSAYITDYVKPICIWDRSVDLNSLIGKLGTVAGWGKDESGQTTRDLRMAKMPVVDLETCVRSSSFFTNLVTDKMFCAGYRNGTTVCNGDSGGGIAFSLDNPAQGRPSWYLRGVVSFSNLDFSTQQCDAFSYVIFTDLAKFMPWIKQKMHLPT